MNHASEISKMDEDQCLSALSGAAQPTSQAWSGITARLQHLQLSKLSNHTAELATRTTELVGIAEAQRVLAVKLDKQTDDLVRLTRWLKWLTLGLFILTICLCFFEILHFFETRKSLSQSEPRTSKTN